MKIATLFLSTLFLSSISLNVHAQSNIKLEHLWTLDGFERPESVYPSADNSELYISSVKGGTTDKDGNGYISRITPDGKIIEHKWISGLNAPKGFVIHNNHIYVTDIDELVIIDISTKQITKRVPVPNAGFLNDVGLVNGKVFFTDSRKSTIYTYTDTEGLNVFLQGENIASPNGLLHDGKGNLIAAFMDTGELVSINISDKSMKKLGTGVLKGDGIGILSDKSYIVTSFPGEIFHIKSENETVKLLDTLEEGISHNDAYMLNGIFYIANMSVGTVTAWKIVKK